jgi:hypothetical protein
VQVRVRFISIFLILSLIFFFARFLAFIRTDVGFDTYDSPSYFNPTWTSPIRMPLISYLFSNLGYFGAINFVQTVFGIVSWVFLAYAITKLSDIWIIKFFASLSVFSLGISSPIAAFDSMILSESLTISAFNFVMAFMLLLFQNFRIYSIFGVCISLIVYSGLKQSNAHFSLIFIICLLFLLLSIYPQELRFRSFFFIVAATLLVNIFFVWIARQNDEINSNVEVTNIIERSFDTFQSQSWWLDRGFPGIAYQAYSSPPTQPPIDTTRALPQVKAWEKFEKNSPIEIFALNHVDFLLFAPIIPSHFIPHFTDFESIYSPLSRGYRMDLNRAVTNLVSGNPEPFFLEELNLPTTFWWQTESNSSKFLFLLLIFPVIIFAYKSSRKDNVFTLGTKLSIYFLVLFAFMAIWANWHISVNYEMARYLMPWAIVLRVIFIICVVTLFENLRKRRILR